VVGAFHGLSRARSDARRYPAIDPLISWTKYLTEVGQELNARLPHWSSKVLKAANILRRGDEIGKRMEVVGEEGVTIDDMVLFLKSELYEFCYLQQNAFDKEDAYCSIERQVELFRLVQKIFDAHLEFDVHDAARSFFLNLQNELKNTNFLPFHSHKYREAMAAVEEKINQKMKKL
jgi:V/A-type H+-transporting ATPase subunit A